MSEIRQALVQADITITATPPPETEEIGLLTLSNPHPEEDPRTRNEVMVVDFHGDEISFAVPMTLLDEIRQLPLANRINDYLVIKGTDISGNNRAYTVRITSDAISKLAFKIYVVLSVARGADFAKRHALAWESWMQGRASTRP